MLSFYVDRVGEYDKSAHETLIAVRALAHKINAWHAEWLAQFDLTPQQFTVLTLLNSTPSGSLPLTDLSTCMHSSRATLTGLIDRLERDGLVRRAAHPVDQRSVLATLTKAGRTRITRLLPRHFTRIASVMASFSEDERGSVVGALARISHALGETAEADR